MIAFSELQARTRNLPVKSVRFDCDVGQDIPTDDRSLQVIDLDTVFKTRLQDLISSRVGRRAIGNETWKNCAHVAHCFRGRVEVHDHSGRHDVPAYVMSTQRKIYVETRHNQTGEEHQCRHAGNRRELRDSCITLHFVAAMTVAVLRGGSRFTFSHQSMLETALYHPHVDRVGDEESDAYTQRHHTPKQKTVRLHCAHVTAHHQKAHGGRHAGHHRVHANEFRQERASDVVPIAAAHNLLHEKRLKDEESKSESRKVLDNKIDSHRQAQRGRNNCSENNAGCIASYAVNRTAHTLLPKR